MIKEKIKDLFQESENEVIEPRNIEFTGGRLFSDIVFFVVIFGVVGLVFNPVVFTGGDNGYYISLSHSILEEGTYRTEFLTDRPYEKTIPPGLPILLALLQIFTGDSLIAMKLLSFFCFGLALLFAHLIMLQFGLRRWTTYLVVLFMATQPLINEYSYSVLTETPFMAFFFAGFYFLESYIRSDKNWKGLILPAILLAFSVLIRIPAVAILPAAFFYIWLRKGFKNTAIFTAVVTVVLLPWLIWMFAAPGGDSFFYIKNFTKEDVTKAETGDMTTSTFLSRIPKNHSLYLFEHMPHLLIPEIAYHETPRWISIVVGSIAGILILIGLFHALRNKQYFIFFLMIFYGGILTFNHTARLRYLVVIVPFILLLFYLASREILQLLKRPHLARLIMFTGVLVLSLFSLFQYKDSVIMNLRILNRYSAGDKYAGLHPVWKNYIDAVLWIRDNTDENALVCARKPRMSYLLSNRRSRAFLFHSDPSAVIEDLFENDIDYVVIDRIRAETGQYLVPAVNANKELFEIVYQTDEPVTYVLRLVKPLQGDSPLKGE